MMVWVTLIGSLLSSPCEAASAVQSFKPLVQALELEDEIVIRGFRGNIDIQGTPGSDKIVIQGKRPSGEQGVGRWNFTVQRKGHQVRIFAKGPSSIEDWKKIRENKVPEFSLSIQAPPRKLSLAWREGHIRIMGWDQALTVSATKGRVETRNTMRDLSIQVMDGRISVAKHEGALNLQSRSGKVLVRDSQGPLDLDVLHSRAAIDNHRGALEVRNFRGDLHIREARSSVGFANGLGSISLEKHRGAVRGRTAGGPVRVQALETHPLDIQSTTGHVNLQLPGRSGAFVSARSHRGQVSGRQALHRFRRGRWRGVRGKLPGAGSSQVKIVSQSGNIVVN